MQERVNLEPPKSRQNSIKFNGPELGEADETLKAALDLHFKGNQWHFSVQGNMLR